MLKRYLTGIFQQYFIQPTWVPFYRHLFKLSLRGMGILNSEGNQITGETWLIQFIKSHFQVKVLFDVGANEGGYTQELLSYFPRCNCYCFEPNPQTFKLLHHRLGKSKSAVLVHAAVSDHPGLVTLYDFSDSAPLKSTQPTATMASLYSEVITDFHRQPAKKYSVKAITLDQFVKFNQISQIDVLKIDVEGHELAVLRGARQLIKRQNINLIQFEFNEMNVYSHTFLKDIIDILPGYTLYRLLPHGWYPLAPYRPLTHEIFGFQNIAAVSPRWLPRLILPSR